MTAQAAQDCRQLLAGSLILWQVDPPGFGTLGLLIADPVQVNMLHRVCHGQAQIDKCWRVYVPHTRLMLQLAAVCSPVQPAVKGSLTSTVRPAS